MFGNSLALLRSWRIDLNIGLWKKDQPIFMILLIQEKASTVFSKGRGIDLSEVGQLQFCRFCSHLIGTLHTFLVQNFLVQLCKTGAALEFKRAAKRQNCWEIRTKPNAALVQPFFNSRCSTLNKPWGKSLSQLSSSFCCSVWGRFF